MADAPVEHHGRLATGFDCLNAGIELGDHASGNGSVGFEFRDVRRRQIGQRGGRAEDGAVVGDVDDEVGRPHRHVLVHLPVAHVADTGAVADAVLLEARPHVVAQLEPGDVVVDAVEGITDLQISYYAIVDLNGFQEIVDAIGGVTLNVRQPIPVGLPSDKFYTHIQPGVKKLDGWETLWYALARHDSDDSSRMARQKCVMNAILQQTSPADVVRHYQDVAKATGSTITTTIPPGVD